MKDRIYLVITQNGVRRMTKGPPSVKPGERTFAINIILPDKIFELPQFSGKMEIKEEDINMIETLEFELNLMKDWSEKQK